MARKTDTNPHGLTLKERKWLKVYIEIGNATQAAREVYKCSTDGSARAQGSKLLAKLSIPVSDLLDTMGISDGRLARLLEDGLIAYKTEIVRHEGKIAAREEFVDWSTRGFYLTLAYKLKGQLVNRVAHEDAQGNVIGPIILPGIPVPTKQAQAQAAPAAPGVPGPGDEASA